MAKPVTSVATGDKHDLEFERDLVARIKDGEREAFAELVRLYQKKSSPWRMDFSMTAMTPWRSYRRHS